MNDARCVVAGVDFSASSRCALDLAAALCRRADLPLLLVHVWNPNQLAGPGVLSPPLESWIEQHRAKLRDPLEAWVQEMRRAGCESSGRVEVGVASRTLPEVARSARAGLLVVGRRGSANLAHVLLGSVSERVAHLAPCPVLVVPDSTAPPRTPQRLLVGIDFSQASRDAYRAALSLAARLGASGGLLLVHAYPDASQLAREVGPELAGDASFERAYRDAYPYDEAALERWARRQASPDLPVAARVVAGNTPRALVAEARREGCDWLVVGLQGQTSLAALLTGSTTDRVLKLADRPVLVVPAAAPGPGEFTG